MAHTFNDTRSAETQDQSWLPAKGQSLPGLEDALPRRTLSGSQALPAAPLSPLMTLHKNGFLK